MRLPLLAILTFFMIQKIGLAAEPDKEKKLLEKEIYVVATLKDIEPSLGLSLSHKMFFLALDKGNSAKIPNFEELYMPSCVFKKYERNRQRAFPVFNLVKGSSSIKVSGDFLIEYKAVKNAFMRTLNIDQGFDWGAEKVLNKNNDVHVIQINDDIQQAINTKLHQECLSLTIVTTQDDYKTSRDIINENWHKIRLFYLVIANKNESPLSTIIHGDIITLVVNKFIDECRYGKYDSN